MIKKFKEKEKINAPDPDPKQQKLKNGKFFSGSASRQIGELKTLLCSVIVLGKGLVGQSMSGMYLWWYLQAEKVSIFFFSIMYISQCT